MKKLALFLSILLGYFTGEAYSININSGSLKSFNFDNGILSLKYKNIVAIIQFINDDVINISVSSSNLMPPKYSYAVIEKNIIANSSIKENQSYLNLSYNDMEIRIGKKLFTIEVYKSNTLIYSGEISKNISNKKFMDSLSFTANYNNERFFGLGEKSGDMELTGRSFSMWNTDAYKYGYETDPLYTSIPFYIAITDNFEYGIFLDSPAKSYFNLKKNDYSYKVEDNIMDFYIFTGDVKKIIQDYTTLTGKPYLPPMWAFGYHQSKYSYPDQKTVIDIASFFIENDIPVDVIHLDIGFMDDNKSFTYDAKNFPNPVEMNQSLAKIGIKTVAIVNPGVKKDEQFDIYNNGLKISAYCKIHNKNDYFVGIVWPGECVFPDFTKAGSAEWWSSNYKRLIDIGIEGFWNDMNEPSVFHSPNHTMPDTVEHYYNGIKSIHKFLHNVYGFTMTEASYKGIEKITGNKRIFLLTRAGYSGIQRYSFIWTGDNSSDWTHLKMNMNMCIGLGLSGVPYNGADIGGYTSGPKGVDEELFTRWIQLATFIPFMRNHSEKGTPYREPYLFKNNIDILRKYIKLRYKLFPYLYTEVYKTHTTGIPIVKPLFLEFGKNYFDVKDEFLFGDKILVAPVFNSNASNIDVILPDSIWYDYWNDKVYKAGKYSVDVSIKDIPVFVRGGSIIPIYEFDIRNTDDFKTKRDLTLKIYPDENGNARGFIYEDDGITKDSPYLITKILYETDRVGERANIQITNEGDFKFDRKLIFVFPSNIQSANINGKSYKVVDSKVEIQ